MSKQDSPPPDFPRKFGKYHLLGPLAQGGMGALYLAVTGDRGLERLLVIKTVLPHLADAEYLARFRDEAKVVVKLSHGNLIPVFDAGQVEGELFLAMDFVEGKDLRALWNRCAHKEVAFPVEVAVHLIKELSRGLGYAHAFGDLRLVHRDVSPPNVLVSYSGELKLTDFGLASSTLKLEKTAPGIIYGKVAYMSPEQARGEPLDGRSDVYAAGIILWELLTGRQLFPPGKEQPAELLKRARDPEVQPPSQRAPRVTAALDAICLKALASRREDRYSTAEELRDALGGWLAAKSPATDSGTIERFIGMLFAEDIQLERQARDALIEKTRARVLTMPPTDELRRMLEEAERARIALGERRRDEGPNLGRRGLDADEDAADRRRAAGRRLADQLGTAASAGIGASVEAGQVVAVPRPGPGGRTAVMGPGGMVATAPAETVDDPGRADVIGQVLDGRYRIEQLIGEGGMGRVYAAQHVDIGKRVAVKILHPVYGRMPDLVERFRREARAASKIGHPNIVDVTDSGTTADGSVYFVMEYLDGVELAAVIDREGALDVARALRVATQICRALSAAHAQGIIHRDLKPENVFLASREGMNDFVKVLDFGIAKSSELEETREKRLTHPGMAMGTPEYMAPEQAAGRPADERCDVYAVGAILYEMLTGSPPYEGENFMEILTKKATQDPTPPHLLRPELPPQVADLCLRAMSRSPADRPPSMEAFEYELTKCLSGRGAAVAKILGMAADPGLSSSLGQGYAGGGAGEGELAASPGMASAAAMRLRNRTGANDALPLPEVPTGRAITSGVVEGRSPGIPSRPQTEPIPDLSGGGIRVVGWVFLSMLLLAGAGAVFLVLDAERSSGGAAPSEAAAPGAGLPAAGRPVEVDSPAAVANDGARRPARREDAARGADPRGAEPDDASAGAPVVAAPGEDRPDGVNRSDRGGDRQSPDRGAAAPSGASAARGSTTRSDGARAAAPPPRTADQMLKDARAAVSDQRLAEAEMLYRKVASGKQRSSEGYLGLADVAFERKRADDVIRWSRKAGAVPRAETLLGHAYYLKKDWNRALEHYQRALAKDPSNQEAQRSRKATCEMLGLSPSRCNR
jgi:serine/threonine protein kinase